MPRARAESESSSSASTAVSPRRRPMSSASSAASAGLASLLHLLNPLTLFVWVSLLLYKIYQHTLRLVFAQRRTLRPGTKPRGRIAVVGAGLTGIASAAHALSHGFEVVIFEAGPETGGIWSNVNTTSQLQLNSILYRFHPAVVWTSGFPKRDEILGQIRSVWESYGMQERTRFNYKVEKAWRDESSTSIREGGSTKWRINDGEEGVFDGIVGAVGTCGAPKLAHFDGQESFRGRVVHSSQLDGEELKGKIVVIVGSGASGVEAADLAVAKGASGVTVLARDDKWIIPRNTVFDVMLALQPFGRQMPLSFIPEWLIRVFHYRDLSELSPHPERKGLFQGTPIVNNDFLSHIRKGLVSYKRGSTERFTPQGVRVAEQDRKGDKTGTVTVEQADVVVLATGFDRPSLEWLPKDLFPDEGDRSYSPPNLYIQVFPCEDWSVVLTNATYVNAIGVVGNFHIGMLTRVLLVFLSDEQARPTPAAAKTWVDVVNWVKGFVGIGQSKAESALAFFTYTELCLWVLTFHLLRPLARLPWLAFVLFGWGFHLKSQEETKGL